MKPVHLKFRRHQQQQQRVEMNLLLSKTFEDQKIPQVN